MKDKVITILRTAAVLIILAVFAAWVVYGTGIFDEILKKRISRQLEDSYGIFFEGDHISDRSPIVPDFDEELAISGEYIFRRPIPARWSVIQNSRIPVKEIYRNLPIICRMSVVLKSLR